MSIREIIATTICNIIFCLMIGIFGFGLGYDSRRKEQDESALEHANEVFEARQDGIKLGEMRMLDRLVCLKLLTEEQAKEVMHGCQTMKS